MTEADVQRLLASEKIRRVAPDPEMAQAELDVARRHIASAEKIMADDPTLAFTALKTRCARPSRPTCVRAGTA